MKKSAIIIILLTLLTITGCKNQDTSLLMSPKDAVITAGACKTIMSANQYINKSIENDLNKTMIGTDNFRIFDYFVEKDIKSNTSYYNNPNHTKTFSFLVNKENYKTKGYLNIFETETNQKLITGNITQTYIDNQSEFSYHMKVSRVSYEQSEYNRKFYIISKLDINNTNSPYLFDLEIRDNNLIGTVFKNDALLGFINTLENTVIIKDTKGKVKSRI